MLKSAPYMKKERASPFSRKERDPALAPVCARSSLTKKKARHKCK